VSRQFKVTVNGREYDVSVQELTGEQAGLPPVSAPLPAGASLGAAAPLVVQQATSVLATGAGDVLAGMGGIVVEVDVKVGQAVAVGERLLVLEAMKMKMPITATYAGRITRVLVAVGDAIEGGQPVATIA
jgi:biotin carboxyl carrier protein